jgi:hypothetical protein
MTEESVSKQPDKTTKESKTDGNPSTKAERQESGTPRHEGQKMVTDSYRQGWERIWKEKR